MSQAITVQRFEYDNWVERSIDQLDTGDLFLYRGQQLVAASPAHKDSASGQWNIKADPPPQRPITLALGDKWNERKHICEVMDMLHSDLEEWAESTAQLAIMDMGAAGIYSPRLPIQELEQYCKTHLEKYRTFAKENAAAIAAGATTARLSW